jgi:hypothetical protein
MAPTPAGAAVPPLHLDLQLRLGGLAQLLEPQVRFTIDPHQIDFGGVQVGSSAVGEATFTNDLTFGNLAFTVGQPRYITPLAPVHVSNAGSFASGDCVLLRADGVPVSRVLGPHQSCTMHWRYLPEVNGEHIGQDGTAPVFSDIGVHRSTAAPNSLVPQTGDPAARDAVYFRGYGYEPGPG